MKNICLFFLLLPVSLFANSDSSSSKLSCKPSLSLNVTPVASMFLGGTVAPTSLGLLYTNRMINEKIEFRVKPQVTFYSNNIYEGFYGDAYRILSQTDSTQARQYNYLNSDPRFALGFGMTWTFGKKLKKYVGFEVFGSYQESNESVMQKDYTLKFDSANTDGNFWIYEPSGTDDKWVSSTSNRIIQVGFRPVFGMSFPLFGRISLLAEISPDMGLSFLSQNISKPGSDENTQYSPAVNFDFAPTGNLASIMIRCQFGK